MSSRAKSLLKGFLVAVGLWLSAVVAALLYFWVIPRTRTGWIAVLVFGPFFLVASEVAGKVVSGLLSRLPGIRHAIESVERQTRGESFSGDRVLAYLGISLLWIIPMVALAMWASPRGGSSVSHFVTEWLRQHFY